MVGTNTRGNPERLNPDVELTVSSNTSQLHDSHRGKLNSWLLNHWTAFQFLIEKMTLPIAMWAGKYRWVLHSPHIKVTLGYSRRNCYSFTQSLFTGTQRDTNKKDATVRFLLIFISKPNKKSLLLKTYLGDYWHIKTGICAHDNDDDNLYND